MTELEVLKQQAINMERSFKEMKASYETVWDEIYRRIEVLENKQEEPETFDSILYKLDKTGREEFETVQDHKKLLDHAALYKCLKRIEGYVNRKFGGNIQWRNHSIYHVWYKHNEGFEIGYTYIDNHGGFYFVSLEAAKYFIQVCKDQLIKFFKTSH